MHSTYPELKCGPPTCSSARARTVPTHSAKFLPSAIMPIPHGPLHSNLYPPTQYTLCPSTLQNLSLLQLCLFLMVLFIQTCTHPHNTHLPTHSAKFVPSAIMPIPHGVSHLSQPSPTCSSARVCTVPTHSAYAPPAARRPLPEDRGLVSSSSRRFMTLESPG